jgi:hypothetical protein
MPQYTYTIHMQVYGGSVRPRTYSILEVVGCTPGGTLSPTVPLEATLKVDACDSLLLLLLLLLLHC